MSKIAKSLPKTSQVKPLETSTFKSPINKPLKVLITRPEAKAQQLASLLNEQDISNTCQALFDYQAYASAEQINNSLNNANILIFVSVAAVNFAHATTPLTDNPLRTIFAVGNATKQALYAIGITKVLSPPAQQEHSEGLLNLTELAAVSGQKVVIFRGNGGREHIADTLTQRGASVSYIESYQRIWRTLPKNIAIQWQAKKINCIVVTSNDILSVLYKYLASTVDSTDHYWQNECLWVVVSERIEQNARVLGLTQVINTHSANSQRLCDTLQALSCS
jgi:uroporphyrinogen-III synthase